MGNLYSKGKRNSNESEETPDHCKTTTITAVAPSTATTKTKGTTLSSSLSTTNQNCLDEEQPRRQSSTKKISRQVRQKDRGFLPLVCSFGIISRTKKDQKCRKI